MGLVPKQLLTVALGGEANLRVFGRTLFHVGLRLKLVSPDGTFSNIYPSTPCDTSASRFDWKGGWLRSPCLRGV
jgi:hypothetical protein